MDRSAPREHQTISWPMDAQGRDGREGRAPGAPADQTAAHAWHYLSAAAGTKLPREFYARPTCEVAVDLLGRRLVCIASGLVRAGRIVETEAYVGQDDRACHASRGRTPRTATMFGPPGFAYVYCIYGMYHCLNAVTEREGFPAAVLIRSLEAGPGVATRTDGPGRLCRALGVDRAHNGADLTGDQLFIEAGDRPLTSARPLQRVVTGPRIGVAYAGEWASRPWRYRLTSHEA